MHNASTIFIAVLSLLHPASCYLKNLGPVKTRTLLKFENRIVGGKRASLVNFPYNVIVLNFGGICGGTILSRKTVLTAAHCFENNLRMEEMRIFANSRYLFDPKAHAYRIWDFQLHEKYNDPVPFSNDIAVMMIHKRFHFSSTVNKAWLCTSDIWKNETKPAFAASGWGEIEYNGKMSPEGLMTTNISLVPADKCTESNKLQLSADMFCLYGDGKRDTCKGDSGGSIIWKGMVVGIVSHGKGCAEEGSPGVYVDVSYHLNWIKKTVISLQDTYCRMIHS